jgi:hypothetical protein
MVRAEPRKKLQTGKGNGVQLSVITENNMICEREINKLTDLQDWVSVLKHVPKD